MSKRVLSQTFNRVGQCVLSALIASTFSFAASASEAPNCMAKGQVLPIDNTQVIAWKTSTANQFRSRAHVEGRLTQIFADHSGHHHFEVTLSDAPGATVEIIFNEGFGALPALAIGQDIEACGDYITSNAPSGGYPASPDGALIHWVHRSPSPRHDSGYVVVDGVVAGLN